MKSRFSQNLSLSSFSSGMYHNAIKAVGKLVVQMKEFDFIFWFGSIPISEFFSVIWIAILTPPIIGILVMGWQEGIKIKHKDSGIERKCFIGFSWTYFLFGFFVPVFRGEITLGIVHAIFVFITFGIFFSA